MEVAAEGLSRRHGFSRLTTSRHLDAGRVHELRASSTKPIYSLRPILLFANTNVSIIKMCLDTSVLAKSIMG
jgi:hypothetical protein